MAIVRVPVRIDCPIGDGGPAMNVWHVRLVDNNPGTWELGQALDALEQFYTGIKALWPSGTTAFIGQGMIVDPLGSPEYVDDDLRTIGPVATVATLPSALLAVVISWRTSSASRSGRGRTFIGPLNAAQLQNDGTPAPGCMTVVRDNAAQLVTSSKATNGWAFGVLSTKQGLLRDFTGSSANDRFSYLSSRRD